MTLQVVLLLVFALGAGLLMYESDYITGTVHDQLAAQRIYFPAASNAAFKALPASDQQAMRPYAGQELTTGAQAQVYANNFIAYHLSLVADGKSYAQVSEAAQANPTNATLAAQRATLFQGEMLRGTLLNAYGWAQFGQYLFLAGIAAATATLVIIGTFVFELVLALNRKPALTTTRRATDLA
ncbi:MAG: hypothetical protein ACREQM_05295 [Candidatus Dormibacteraceae bacterium]